MHFKTAIVLSVLAAIASTTLAAPVPNYLEVRSPKAVSGEKHEKPSPAHKTKGGKRSLQYDMQEVEARSPLLYEQELEI
jgi:hypothetical protein